ncbi:PqqD family protein [Syntrophaceticus schinkii]|jgi:ABC-type polysaccharide/polyol phosphate transport system ATPase subunit|uniref:PqqD family protein n=1 Tax=Syntrophaceticus schinkii TaxID=499207 RepID=UPI0005CBBA86|nr:PqqD family protein [Syntrophaceticus schinkii]
MFGSILPDCCPKQKCSGVMERQEDDKLVLYRGHQLIVLGSYSSEIWHLCDGNHTVDEMIKMVVDKYSVPQEKAEQEISGFLSNLAEKKLVSLE